MSLILSHSGLSKDFSLILNDADDFNVIIQVGENQNAKEFRAHSVILRARSPYFKTALSSDWVTKENDMIIFKKPNITPTVFDMILKYIYTGELYLGRQSYQSLLGLLVASDELLIEGLSEYVQKYLMEKKSTLVKRNLVDVLNSAAFKLEKCKELQDCCIEYICEDPQPFITSSDFLSLNKDIVLDLFTHDAFQTEEIIGWDSLIKWGIKQTPELENKSSHYEWTDEDYENLKNTLSDIIPFIKFAKITLDDFYNKVRPFKSIIPNNIYEKIIKPTLLDVSTNISNIISNWIDGNDSIIHLTNNNYKFNLIYVMTRDGCNYKTFHDKCIRQGPFVVFVKTQSNKIYGGYNPIGYAKRKKQWLTSDRSFVFSFEDGHTKIGRVINANKSIRESYGAHFFNFGNYLYISGINLNFCKYEKNYDPLFNFYHTNIIDFPIEEIEVFSVTEKEIR